MGDLDANDFLIWQRNYEMLSGAAHTDGDANNDQKVRLDDEAIWESEFGSTNLPTPLTGTAVPEPGSILLFTMGIVLAIGYSLRQRIHH